MRAALGRREGHPAVVALASVVVRRVGNPVALGIVNAAQIRIAQRAVVSGTASQIDDVGAPRHQLDGEPVLLARRADGARGRVAHRHPPARRRVRRKVLAVRLGDRLRHALIRLHDRPIVLHRLVHVGHVDGHAGVGRLIPVARPHDQLEAGGTGLVVLAPARVEQLAAGRVDLEPPRLVAALDAVAHRTAVRIRRRNRAQRYPVRAAVGVLRQIESVALLVEGRRWVDGLGRGHVAHRQRVAPDLVAVARHPHVVAPAVRWRERHAAVAAAVEIVVVGARLVAPVAVVDRPQVRVGERAAPARAALQVELVGPSPHQLDGKPVLVVGGLDGAGGGAADGDRAGGLCVGRIIVRHNANPSSSRLSPARPTGYAGAIASPSRGSGGPSSDGKVTCHPLLPPTAYRCRHNFRQRLPTRSRCRPRRA